MLFPLHDISELAVLVNSGLSPFMVSASPLLAQVDLYDVADIAASVNAIASLNLLRYGREYFLNAAPRLKYRRRDPLDIVLDSERLRRLGWGDCEDLAGDELARRLARGEQATGWGLLYPEPHAVILTPYGIFDPSLYAARLHGYMP